MSNPISKNDLRNLTKEMYRVHDHGYLRVEGQRAMQYRDMGRLQASDPVPLAKLPGFYQFVCDDNEPAMERTSTRT